MSTQIANIYKLIFLFSFLLFAMFIFIYFFIILYCSSSILLNLTSCNLIFVCYDNKSIHIQIKIIFIFYNNIKHLYWQCAIFKSKRIFLLLFFSSCICEMQCSICVYYIYNHILVIKL